MAGNDPKHVPLQEVELYATELKELTPHQKKQLHKALSKLSPDALDKIYDLNIARTESEALGAIAHRAEEKAKTVGSAAEATIKQQGREVLFTETDIRTFIDKHVATADMTQQDQINAKKAFLDDFYAHSNDHDYIKTTYPALYTAITKDVDNAAHADKARQDFGATLLGNAKEEFKTLSSHDMKAIEHAQKKLHRHHIDVTVDPKALVVKPQPHLKNDAKSNTDLIEL